MPKEWLTGELVTAAEFNLLPRVLYRDVLSSAVSSVTIADADILGTLADWETLKLTVHGDNDGTSVIANVRLRFNSDTGTNYRWRGTRTKGDGAFVHRFEEADDDVVIGLMSDTAQMTSQVEAVISGHSRSDRRTVVQARSYHMIDNTASNVETFEGGGIWNVSTVVTSLSVQSTTNNLDAGTLVMLEGCMRREPA